MHLQELKRKSPAELLAFAEELGIENASNLRRQDLLFAILKILAEKDTSIDGDGVLVIGIVGGITDASARGWLTGFNGAASGGVETGGATDSCRAAGAAVSIGAGADNGAGMAGCASTGIV